MDKKQEFSYSFFWIWRMKDENTIEFSETAIDYVKDVLKENHLPIEKGDILAQAALCKDMKLLKNIRDAFKKGEPLPYFTVPREFADKKLLLSNGRVIRGDGKVLQKGSVAELEPGQSIFAKALAERKPTDDDDRMVVIGSLAENTTTTDTNDGNMVVLGVPGC